MMNLFCWIEVFNELLSRRKPHLFFINFSSTTFAKNSAESGLMLLKRGISQAYLYN